MCEKVILKFFKKQITKLNVSLDQRSETLYGLFLLHVQVEHYQTVLKQRCLSRAFTLYDFF